MDYNLNPLSPSDNVEFLVSWIHDFGREHVEDIIARIRKEADCRVLDLTFELFRGHLQSLRLIAKQEFKNEVEQISYEIIRNAEESLGNKPELPRETPHPRHRQRGLQYLQRALDDPPESKEDHGWDGAQYPNMILSYPHRAVWNDLFNVPDPRHRGLDIYAILGDPQKEKGYFEQFLDRVGCDATHNHGGNIVYLGADKRENVDRAVHVLRTLLLKRIEIPSNDLHLLYPQTPAGEYFIGLINHSQCGLFKPTFLEPLGSWSSKESYFYFSNHGQCLTMVRRDGCPSSFKFREPVPVSKRPAIQPDVEWAVFRGHQQPPKAAWAASETADTGPTDPPEAVRADAGPADFYQSVRADISPTDFYKALRANTGPTEFCRSVRADNGPTNLCEMAGPAETAAADSYEAVRADTGPADFYRSVRADVGPTNLYGTGSYDVVVAPTDTGPTDVRTAAPADGSPPVLDPRSLPPAAEPTYTPEEREELRVYRELQKYYTHSFQQKSAKAAIAKTGSKPGPKKTKEKKKKKAGAKEKEGGRPDVETAEPAPGESEELAAPLLLIDVDDMVPPAKPASGGVDKRKKSEAKRIEKATDKATEMIGEKKKASSPEPSEKATEKAEKEPAAEASTLPFSETTRPRLSETAARPEEVAEELGCLQLSRMIRRQKWSPALLGRLPESAATSQNFVETSMQAIRELAARLEAAEPGSEASLRAHFGRIILLEADCLAHDSKTKSSWIFSTEKILPDLNATFPVKGRGAVFSSVLSIFGHDANMLARMAIDDPWKEAPETKVTYELVCRDTLRPDFKGMISIDSENFDVTYSEMNGEDPRILVHCLQHPHDVAVTASWSNPKKAERAMTTLGEYVRRSMQVRHDADGLLCVRFELPRGNNAKYIAGVRIRYHAEFPSRSGKTCLNISKVHKMMSHFKYGTPTPSVTCSPQPAGVVDGQPTLWYEANVSSPAADKMFRRGGWTASDLERKGVFDSLFRQSMRVVQGLDPMGCHNDNGMGREFGMGDGEAAPKEKEGFW